MTTEILILLITNIVAPILTGTVTWILAKKKYNAEVDGAKIDNLSKIIDILSELIKNLQERLDVTLERNKQLELEVVDLRKQMFNLMSSICLDFTCKNRKQEDNSRGRRPKDTKDPRYAD